MVKGKFAIHVCVDAEKKIYDVKYVKGHIDVERQIGYSHLFFNGDDMCWWKATDLHTGYSIAEGKTLKVCVAEVSNKYDKIKRISEIATGVRDRYNDLLCKNNMVAWEEE